MNYFIFIIVGNRQFFQFSRPNRCVRSYCYYYYLFNVFTAHRFTAPILSIYNLAANWLVAFHNPHLQQSFQVSLVLRCNSIFTLASWSWSYAAVVPVNVSTENYFIFIPHDARYPSTPLYWCKHCFCLLPCWLRDYKRVSNRTRVCAYCKRTRQRILLRKWKRSVTGRIAGKLIHMDSFRIYHSAGSVCMNLPICSMYTQKIVAWILIHGIHVSCYRMHSQHRYKRAQTHVPIAHILIQFVPDGFFFLANSYAKRVACVNRHIKRFGRRMLWFWFGLAHMADYYHYYL